MRYFALFLAVLAGLIFQSTYLEALRVGGLKPDAVMLLVIFFAIQQGPAKGAFFGFFAGLLEDLFTGKFLGLHAALKCLIGFLCGLLEKRVYKENIFVPAFLGSLATFLQEAIYIILRQLAGYLTQTDIPFVKSVSMLSVYHFMLAIVGYYFFMRLTQKGVLPRPRRRFLD